MATSAAVHPSDETLQSYGLGKLDDMLAEAVVRHLGECDACRRRVAEVTSDTFVGRLQDAQARPKTIPPAGSSLEGLSKLGGESRMPSPPPADTLPPGLAEHPDYQVLRELGRGGMGVVYLAENRMMGRKEVLKVVSSHLLNRKGVLERFLREIRSAAQLNHPNIVTAYAATRVGESVVFSMQYVEGYDLAKLVDKSGPLSVPQACNFVCQAALGLQHAHEHGMVHRDIKPSNLMLARDGNKPVVKVLDFGLAKVTSEGTVDGGLTSEGQMLGTPHYVAPEQTVNAQTADIRADIYSLGCTLYCLLTGHPPFDAPSLYELLQAHHSMDAKPLNFIRPEVPAELAAVVAKMLAKEPERRYQTPGEVARALTPFFKKGGIGLSGVKADLSQAGEGAAKPQPAATGSVATPSETGTVTSPAPLLEEVKIASPSESKWESLLGIAETKQTGEAKTATKPSRWPRWPKPSIREGMLVIALGIVLAAVILRVWTSNGVLELKELPEGAEVFVDKNRVTISYPGEGNPAEISVPEGEHFIVVKKDGIQIIGTNVSMTKGGRTWLSAKLVQKEEKPDSKLPPATPEKAGSMMESYGRTMAEMMRKGQSQEAPSTGGGMGIGRPGAMMGGMMGGGQKDETSPQTKAILAKLEESIKMNFPNETPLEEVLKHVKEATKGPSASGIPIYVDPLGLHELNKTMTSPVTIDQDEIPLKDSLRLALNQLGLASTIKDGLLFIGSPASVQQEQSETEIAADRESPRTKDTLTRLDAPVAMSFPNETKLVDVLNYVKSATKGGTYSSGIPIHVDPNGLKETQKTLTSPVVIDVQGVSLKTTLRLLLKQLGDRHVEIYPELSFPVLRYDARL